MLNDRSCTPAGRTDRRDAVGDGIGALGQAADRGRLGWDDLERGVGDEQDPVGPAHRLLRVDEPLTALSRLQDEVTGAHGMGTQVLDERLTRHDLQTTAVILRVFTEPQQGASYDDLLAVARRAEELGVRRVLPVRPLPEDGRRLRASGPDRRVDDARRPRPRHEPDPPRHAGHARRRSACPARSRSRSRRSTR